MKENELGNINEKSDVEGKGENEPYKYDVAVVLGGGFKEHGDRKKTTVYSEGDANGALGARARIIAAEYIYKKGNVARNFLVATGKEHVEAQELISRGIPQELVYIEDNSGNTQENIVNLLRKAKEMAWERILILSSDYHIPRIRALYGQFLKEHEQEYMGLQIDFQGAEDILVETKPKWKKYVAQAYVLDEMVKRQKNEAKGLDDIKAGKYNSTAGNKPKQ